MNDGYILWLSHYHPHQTSRCPMISQGEHLAAALLPLRAPGARLARRAHGAAAEAFRIVGIGDQHLRPRGGIGMSISGWWWLEH